MRVHSKVRLDFLALGHANPVGHEWQPLGPCDANHRYLPRDDHSIDATTLNSALVAGPNFDPDALSDVVARALSTSTTGNSSTSNLDDTVKHNVIEYDGSFQEMTYIMETICTSTPILGPDSFIFHREASNPDFTIPSNSTSSLAETVFYHILFGNRVNGNTPTKLVKIFFEQDIFPFAEGYAITEEMITLEHIHDMLEEVRMQAQ
ncbi:putative Heme haloperoxidase family profile domain-containing protein [Seiridium cardinale]